MDSGVMFVLQSGLLGVGLAMDAFSVSLANGMSEPQMKRRRMAGIAGVFGLFQFLMPLAGWAAVHTAVEYLSSFERFVPWIAFFLLLYIGGKMILDGINPKEEEKEVEEEKAVAKGTLFLQGIATSIDALSVGFTIATYNAAMAIISSLIIGFVTFGICAGGLILGRTLGMKLAGKASVLGGVILVAIGIRILMGSF